MQQIMKVGRFIFTIGTRASDVKKVLGFTALTGQPTANTVASRSRQLNYWGTKILAMSSNRNQLPSFDSAELKELKEKLVSASHILDNEGITDGFGHVSVRIPNQQAFITLAGVSPGCATVNRLVMLDFDGNYLGGEKAPPYEWPIHACILRARPDVMSVCHTHSKWSSLFSILQGALRPVHMYAKFLPPSAPPIHPAVGLLGLGGPAKTPRKTLD